MAWEDWFADHDVLLCPVSAGPAFPHDQSNLLGRTVTINGEPRSAVGASAWCGLIGVIGLPSAVVPVGRTAGGLPVGLQVVGPYLHDRQVVSAAGLIGDLVGGYRPPPGFGPQRPTA
jgi:amidase